LTIDWGPVTRLVLIAGRDWPNGLESTTLLLFLAAIVGLPVLGYWLTVLDIRAYLRALRGVLVRLTHPRNPHELPAWVQDDDTPSCLRAMGLSLPCTNDDLKEAYRRLAKELHPDRGGDVQRFLMLQTHMEQATHFLQQQAKK